MFIHVEFRSGNNIKKHAKTGRQYLVLNLIDFKWNYNRIRIGINHPGSKDLVSNYVLNKFTNDEMSLIEKKLDKVTNNFNTLLDDQVLFLTKLAEDN